MSEPDEMPVGECCVCEDDLDHSNAGFCLSCDGAFCWGSCGNWFNGDHCCKNCIDVLEVEENNESEVNKDE